MRRLLLATLLVALAASVVGAPLAAAETGGFFKFEKMPTKIVGEQGGGHSLHFVAPGLSSEVGCGPTLEGKVEGFVPKTEDLRLNTIFSGCTVTSTKAAVPIDNNSCWFTFRMAKTPVHETEQTMVLECPAGKSFTITRPDCTIVVPNQFFTGVTYGQTTNLGKSAVTVSFNSQMAFRYEAGACAFLGTAQTGTLKGSLTLKGWTNEGQATGIDVQWDEALGHFLAGVEHPTITGTENAEDRLHLTVDPLGGEMGCKKATYSLTTISETTQVTTVAPVNEECSMTGTGGEAGVAFNECTYRFDVVAGSTSETEQKVDYVCPAGKSSLLSYAGCLMAVSTQNDIGKITYTTVEEGGDHAITLDVNAEFKAHTFAGPCTALGTTLTGTLKGSVLVKAFSPAGEQVDLTAT